MMGEGYISRATIDEKQEYITHSEEMNERIYKLIQTFLRKLDSTVYLDQIYTTHEDFENEERGGKLPTLQDSKGAPPVKNNFSTNKTATALAEERSLI